MLLIYGDIPSDFHPEEQSNIGLETSYSHWFLLCLSKFLLQMFYLFNFSHMQEVVFWTLWKILYCLFVCLVFSSQIKVTCQWINWKQPSLQLCWPVSTINLQLPTCCWPKGEKLSFAFSHGTCTKSSYCASFHWLQSTYCTLLIRWPHIYLVINAINMLPNQKELAGVPSIHTQIDPLAVHQEDEKGFKQPVFFWS